MTYIIHADGGARGNPGPAALGFIIETSDHTVMTRAGEYIGTLTNNQAEYHAVVAALSWMRTHRDALPQPVSALEVVLDSELLVNQLSGTFKIKSPGLRDLAIFVKNLERQLGTHVTYSHVPRAENAAADRLVNVALDGYSAQNRI